MQQHVDMFLQRLRQDGDTAENTLSAYQTDLGQLVGFMCERGCRAWPAVTYDALLAFQLHLRERGYADSTIARRTAAVRSFFTFLHEQGLIPANPTEQIDAPKVTYAPPQALTPVQVDALLELPLRNPTPERMRDKAMLEVLYATGMQVSELIDLNGTDVDLAAGTVSCRGRGGRTRTLPLGEAAGTAVEEYLDNARSQLARNAPTNPALFLNHRGKRLSRQGIWLILQGYAQELGVAELTPRTLRTTFAAHMLRDGADVNDLQRLLGHAARTSTQVYTQTLVE
jgi:integrase/recombinase XerD